MKRLLLFCAVIALRAPALSAETFTLENATAAAFEHNPDLQKARSAVRAAEARRAQSYAAFFPSVSLNALYVYVSEPPPRITPSVFLTPGTALASITGNPLLQYVAQNNYSGYVRINEPLFTGGRNRSAYRAAGADYAVQQAAYRRTKEKLRVDVISAFYGVLVARQMKVLTEEATRQLQEHLDTVEKFLNAGTATEYDHLKAQVQLLTWSPKVVSADRELKNAVRRLNLLAGRDPDAPAEVDGALEFQPYTGALSPAQAKGSALERRPELLQARAQKEAAAFAVAARRAGYLPQLNLQYNYNLLDQQADFTLDRDAWKNWWDLRLLLSWEVFNVGRTAGEVRESAARLEQAATDEAAVRDRIIMEVEDAAEYLAQTQKNVELWQKNVQLAERGYAIADDKYRNGRMTNVDVLDSQVALTDAKVQYLKALYDYRVARADFERAIGMDKGDTDE